jgi:hypothetical protein
MLDRLPRRLRQAGTGVATIGILPGSLASLFHLEGAADEAEEAQAGEERPLHEELAGLRAELQEVDRRLGAVADRAH